MKFLLALVLCLALTNASQRFIIEFDDQAWDNFQLSSAPSSTVHVLTHLKMIVADLSTEEISTFSTAPGVKVHPDSEVYAFGVQENPNNWGIDRIDQQKLPLDRKFNYGNEGQGVNVYVLDTGVATSHAEFEGRAKFVKNFADDGRDVDCQGHGTHVSSTIGGKTVGVAKKANILGVKVLNCKGSGSSAGVIAGINLVVGEHKASQNKKNIINMSLGGPKEESLNAAVNAAIKAGVTFVVAAGNERRDACLVSPASVEAAITVAASNSKDLSAIFTNNGKCVDLYGPGVKILGANLKGGFKALSGTSMASPHVAGVAALVMGAGLAETPAQVKRVLLESGIKGTIKLVPANTPNLLVYANPEWKPKQEVVECL